MRFMVMVKATDQSEAGILPDSTMLERMGAFNEELAKAGMLLGGEGLQPSSKGARITFAAEGPTLRDGPFAEITALVAGFWIIQAKSKGEAIEWMSRCPFESGEELEIRQIYEAEDFGAAMSPDMREQEKRLRAEIGSK